MVSHGQKVRLRNPLAFGREHEDRLPKVKESRAGGYRIELGKDLFDVGPHDLVPITTIAYQYGLLDPPDWDQDCHEQLYLMNRLWNSLVEIEHEHRTQYRALFSNTHEIAPLEERAHTLENEQADLRAQRKGLRQQAGARVPTPAIDARLREIAKDLQLARGAAKQMRTAIKDRLQPQITALQNERFEAAKKARQQSQLYWGNYNAVLQAYETARSQAMKDGTELKFRRFDGQGRFVVQLQDGCNVEGLTQGTKPVKLDLTPTPIPGRKGVPRPRLSMTVYTRDRQPRLVTWPIIYNRPLPEGFCRIQNVVVTRRRVATRWRYAVVFTCLIDTPPSVSPSEASCGINLGFRTTSAGLRVATIHAKQYTYRLQLSNAWMSHMDALEVLHQERDKARNQIHAVLKAHWPERPANIPEEFGERLENLVKAQQISTASLASIAICWRKYPDWWPAMFQRLESWRSADKKQFEREANDREHMMLVRREQYRLFARDLAQRFGLIRIGKIDLRSMAVLETADGAENKLHQRARRNRTRASLYLLQCEIEKQAAKFGSRVEYIGGATTTPCHQCGDRCAVSKENVMHVCEHCGAVWDQDENAARNILLAGTPRPAAEESLSA